MWFHTDAGMSKPAPVYTNDRWMDGTGTQLLEKYPRGRGRGKVPYGPGEGTAEMGRGRDLEEGAPHWVWKRLFPRVRKSPRNKT